MKLDNIIIYCVEALRHHIKYLILSFFLFIILLCWNDTPQEASTLSWKFFPFQRTSRVAFTFLIYDSIVKEGLKRRRCPQVTNCFFCGGNATASKWALLEVCPVTLIEVIVVIQSTPVISMPKGLSEILRDIRFDISDFTELRKKKSNKLISQMNMEFHSWSILKTLWKRGGIAP